MLKFSFLVSFIGTLALSTNCFAQTMPSEYGNGLSNRPATSTTSAFPTVTSQPSTSISSPAPSLIPAFNSSVVNNNNTVTGFGNNVGYSPNNGAFGNNGNQVNTGYGGYNGGQTYGSQSNCGTTGYVGVAGGRGDAIGNSQSAISLQVGVTFGEQKCVDQQAIERVRSGTELAKEKESTTRWCVGAMIEAGKLTPSPQTTTAIENIMKLCNK